MNGNAGTHVVMTEEVREKMSRASKKNNRKRIENGTHHFLGGEIQRKTQKKRVENGTHHLLGPEFNRKRVENGNHNFLGGEAARKNAKKRVEDGTHHLLGGEIQRKNNLKRVENGTHNLQVKGMMTALNIETGEVHRITKELYYSRRDIYFHNTSKVFKEWKFNNL